MGYRTISKVIRRDDKIFVNREKIRRLMRAMGVYTIYPKPDLSKRYHEQYLRPYLLRNLKISFANQVWGIDITYVRMQKGFMYLFYHHGLVLQKDCRLRTVPPLEKTVVMNCLKRALTRAKPEIINSDQGIRITWSY